MHTYAWRFLALALALLALPPAAAQTCTPRSSPLDIYVAANSRVATPTGTGTQTDPFSTIAQATAIARAGDRVWIAPSTYRETIAPTCAGTLGHSISFDRWNGQAGEVIISGSERLGGIQNDGVWVVNGNHYQWTWQARPGWVVNSEGYFGFRNPTAGLAIPLAQKVATRAELLVARDPASSNQLRPLRPVLSLAALQPGTFYIETRGTCDYDAVDSNGYINTWDCAPSIVHARFWADQTPVQSKPEIGVREILFKGIGNSSNNNLGGYYSISNMSFRFANNRYQYGAICLNYAGDCHPPGTSNATYGKGSVLINVEIAYNNSVGISISGHTNWFIGSSSHDNGQQGILGICESCIISDSYTYGNNWKGYDQWEAGGIKLLFTNNTLIRRVTSSNNDGAGIWLDTDSDNNVIEGNVLVNNLRNGIFLEGHADNNLVQHNVVTSTRRMEYQLGSGLQISASTNNHIYHNSFFGNAATGILVEWDPRGPNAGNQFANNLIAFTGSNLIWSTQSTDSANELFYMDQCSAASSNTYFNSNVIYDHSSSTTEYPSWTWAHSTFFYKLGAFGDTCGTGTNHNNLSTTQTTFGETGNSILTRTQVNTLGYNIPTVVVDNGTSANPQWGYLQRATTVSTATLPTCSTTTNSACAVNTYAYSGAYPDARYSTWLNAAPTPQPPVASVARGSGGSVYPNPAASAIHVSPTPTTTAVRVLDILGRTVLTQAVEPGAGPSTLDVSALSNGVYVVVIDEEAGTQRTFRVTVTH